MCNKKTSSNQQSTSTSDLTQWSKDQMTEGKDRIRGVIDDYTSKPVTPYGGSLVADLSADEVTARDMARNLNLRAAVNYRTFADFDPATYYNPYEREVVDATAAYMDENTAKQTMANQARQTANKSFGGSRHGVADAEFQRTGAMDKAKMMADTRFKSFESAADRFTRDSDSIYGADVRNSDAAYNDVVDKIGMLSKLGAGQREIEQMKLLAEKSKYDEVAAEELRRMQLRLQTEMGLFGSTPMLTTNTSSGSSTSKTSDPLGSIASIAGGVGGLFGGIGSIWGPK